MEKTELKKPRVAVACGGTRKEAVGNALNLVRDDILTKVRGLVLVKPNFLSSVTKLASTQAGAVRPVLELLRESKAERIIIGEGGSRSTSQAMEGEGPGGGSPVDMKLAVAGTDPVACDAVMASMMGFEPMSVGYLALAHERCLGVADLNLMEIVGENPDHHRRHFKPHSNYPYQQRWREAWNK